MTLLPGNGNTTSLKLLKTAAIPTGRLRKPLKILPRSFTRKTKGFFFNVGDGNINSTKGIIKYLGRYLARAPIAEYKITDITDKEVTFFFNDLANDKKKTCITMPSETFVSHILIHLPPKNFKMVNRYGFYSRHISGRLKEAIDAFRKNIAVSRYSFYQRQMYRTFGMNPF
ncbi:transposase [Leptotrichia trevisanii]|uniref:transposase n=1 Tax=Leptotrichia trevisanii TaxID=109328 RepID=UPI00156593FD|nr:transposase [Leptotrichia trevisanii]